MQHSNPKDRNGSLIYNFCKPHTAKLLVVSVSVASQLIIQDNAYAPTGGKTEK